MRICVVADIHGNIAALDTVLADADARGFDQIVCLGDVVGYGPFPADCLDRLKERDAQIVQGNHEAGLLRLPTRGRFNEFAEQAINYTREILGEEHRRFVEGFVQQVRMGDDALFVHGSPFDRDEYLVYDSQIQTAIENQETWLCFCGHTHLQFVHDGQSVVQGEHAGYGLSRDHRYLINPGSVGQPRDRDPRTAYALLDLEAQTLDQVRLEYDVHSVANEILRVGLPEYSAQRLLIGR